MLICKFIQILVFRFKKVGLSRPPLDFPRPADFIGKQTHRHGNQHAPKGQEDSLTFIVQGQTKKLYLCRK